MILQALWTAARAAVLVTAILGCAATAPTGVRIRASGPPDDRLTVAEKSNFTATARYDDVVALCDKLAETSKLVHKSELGKTVQGRSLPLLLVADPPVSTPQEAAR